jgi:anti-sigma factor RsiW
MSKLNCQEAQILLEAFHDNELDGVSSLLVQEHLDECPDCRRQWRWLCEVEVSLQRLSESTPSAPEDLRRRILRRTSSQASPVLRFFRAHVRLTSVSALALLLAIAATITLKEETPADVMLFVRDSAKMAQNAAPGDLRTSNPKEAEERLKQHLGFAPPVPNPSGFKLTGVRCCHINRESVGLLLFERNGQQLSCYIGRSSMIALRGFDDVTREGIKLGTCEGRHIAAWGAGNVSYLMVSDLTKGALLAVANEVVNSTSQSLKQ